MSEEFREIHACNECGSNCKLDSTSWPEGYLNGQLCSGSKWIKTEIPKHETVEQWEERTGETYPDDGPVWYSDKITDGFELVRYGATKFISGMFSDADICIVIANHHGKPELHNG